MHTILVVDDFQSIRDFLAQTLNKIGYRTILASDGEEAYSIAVEQKDQIDLILSDFNMPKLNGMDLLKKLKENGELKHIPVIFLTTEANVDHKSTARDIGLFAWIKKPYKLPLFKATIENALKNVN